MKDYSELKNYIIKDIVDDRGEIRDFIDDIDEHFILKGDESIHKDESGFEFLRKNGYIYGKLFFEDRRIVEFEFEDNGGNVFEDIFEGKYIVTRDNVILIKYRGSICSKTMQSHGHGVMIRNGKKYIATWIDNCEVKNNLVKIISGNGLKYEGEVDYNLVPNGKGRYIYPFGARYEGDVFNDKATGKGILILKSGSVYKGDVLDGLPHGKGKMISSNGTIYEGDFLNGTVTGNTRKIYPDGTIYEGDVLDFSEHGKGIITLKDGTIYEGDFLNGKATGKGRKIHTSGAIYEGDFLNGKATGKGRKIHTSGAIYEGDFLNGKATGKGIITLKDGTIYEGDVLDSLPHGKGKMIYTNGKILEGNFFEGGADGKGIITLEDGTRYEGNLLDGIPHGKGKLIFLNGKILEGDFLKGSFKEQCNVTKTNKASNTGIGKIFKFIKDIIGFSDDNNSYSSSSSEDKYLDVASAMSHGMSIEDIVKYNTGDWDTSLKYREKALNIDKSDEFYMG